MTADNLYIYKETKYPYRKIYIEAKDIEDSKIKLRKEVERLNKILETKMVFLEFKLEIE